MPKTVKKRVPEFERGKMRGIKEGSLIGYEMFAVILLMVLRDKHGWEKDDIRTLWDEIRSYTLMVKDGIVSFDEMKKALSDEYGISFKWNE